MEQNYFLELNKINVNDKTEKKNGLTYLSWAWAWGKLKITQMQITQFTKQRRLELSHGRKNWLG